MRSEYHHLESVDSTQTFAKKHISSFDPKAFTIISADEQLKGKGRFNRHWYSSKGNSVLTTYCFFVEDTSLNLGPITLVLALSICEVLQKLGLRPKIKWPNDVFLHSNKCAGILAEVEPKEGGQQVFLGYGLNVNLSEEELRPLEFEATSLFIETNRKWTLDQLSTPIEILFKRDLSLFLEKGFEPFHAAYEDLSFFHGKTVRLDLGHEVTAGSYVGIDKSGAIILKLKDGSIKTFVSGEIIDWE
jgi:BirA family biotin operon repressor/biotin-[acetyl-CoA-carboxylase] ligase